MPPEQIEMLDRKMATLPCRMYTVHDARSKKQGTVSCLLHEYRRFAVQSTRMRMPEGSSAEGAFIGSFLCCSRKGGRDEWIASERE